ncbi:hypothetical protein OSB04_027539 [Centaurea solstitialis]|uniref:Uncharacterized protein n=1 Tax=Centaurea solstitialis TaxID=347529 RepID=A0AA38SEU1_9ASTR|nr:hypothetical protein OSB04_027539 [Centaurea solstitialis]
MGKVSPKEKMSKTSSKQTSKQKRRINGSNKYLKPGALAQLRNSKASASKSCTDIGKKKVDVMDAEKTHGDILFQDKCANDIPIILSPEKFRYNSVAGPVDLLKENNLQRTPGRHALKGMEQIMTPGLNLCQWNCCSNGRNQKSMLLEQIGYQHFFFRFNLIHCYLQFKVKILCHLHHDQLRAVFHVSERVRKAVVIARQFHFNYTTPDRSRQEILCTSTPLPTEHWPFMSKGDGKSKNFTLPSTPKAPRHGPRPPSRLKLTEMRQIAAVLFQESSAFPPRYIVPSLLPKPICKSFASNRVLFYDEELELCQAVAQNKLR